MIDALARFAPALGLTLVHFLWQGALIGAFSAVVLRALRHARPQVRYAVACLALLACVLAPCLTFSAHLSARGPLSTLDWQAGLPATQIAGWAAPAAGLAVSSAPILTSSAPWIAAFWALGASSLSVRLALGLVWIRRLRRTPQTAMRAEWRARLATLAPRFGLGRPVELLLVDGLPSPLAAGWWRPIVILPAALLSQMPADRIEALLAHELAHIRRHDYLVNLLQSGIEALLFYHPVTWWLSRRIRVEREAIADLLAAEVTGEPRRLALALAELSELQVSHPGLQLAQAAHGGHLRLRIERLLAPRRHSPPPGAWIFLPIALLVAAGLTSYTYAQLGAGRFEPTISRAARLKDPARLSFALARADRPAILAWGPDDDVHLAAEAHRAADRDVLLIRRGGRDFVVTAAPLLGPIRQAWDEAEALEQRVAILDEQLRTSYQSGSIAEIEALQKKIEPVAVRLAKAHEDLPGRLRHLVDEAWARDLALSVEPQN